MTGPRRLEQARCIVFDLDGTLYLGSRLLPGARELLAFLRGRAIPHVFLTNNSSRSRQDYTTRLNSLGLEVSAPQMITSGEATARYLQRCSPGAPLYLVGTPTLEQEFR